ncbi:MAG: ribonuclease PH [Anaerolineales bacterium]|nr:MAG: ribonuclease PH [Anaerolineales bacterium]
MTTTNTGFERVDGRSLTELRPLQFQCGFIAYPEGSVLIQQGNTHVLCNVSIERGIPAWMQSRGVQGGWVTAEYAMLPRATHQRSPRETLRPRSRSQEIRRLIGRALRAALHLEALPPLTCIVDCDVLQADGGTRAASICGGYIALVMALQRVLPEGVAFDSLLKAPVAAVSVGWLQNQILLDLNYEEDSTADADLNVVMNRDAAFIEVQGTAERGSLPRPILESMLDVAQAGIEDLLRLQTECLEGQGIQLRV